MKRSPDPIDKLVGQNIRLFRTDRGISQAALAKAAGVTFQQVQKYEKGANRVGSGRLAKIAEILDVPISRFFQTRSVGGIGDDGRDDVTELLTRPYALRMLKALSKIPDRTVLACIVALTESLAKRH